MSPQAESANPRLGPDYSTWSTSSLIERITELERQLHTQTGQFASAAAADSSKIIDITSAPTPEDAEPSVGTPVPAPTQADAPEEDFTRTPSRHFKQPRDFDPSKYHNRFIALKFAYLGQRYNGYEHANGNVTPLPTIEEELWKALRKTRLIFPKTASSADDFTEDGPRVLRPYTINWEGTDYSKCGRTDRGVSAFGQVIGIRVRSARPKKPSRSSSPVADRAGSPSQLENQVDDGLPALDLSDSESGSDVDSNWDDVADELPYIQMLNSSLPEDIRVLAWCPHPPEGFDARFSCRERQYRYFFTQPAFSPTPGTLGLVQGAAARKFRDTATGAAFREGWLDIDAMRKAAKYLEGLHDFRNFCKVDTSKQITNFMRRINFADIELVDSKTSPLGYVRRPGFEALPTQTNGTESDESLARSSTPSGPQVYTFTIHGSAFLWHQVRHMVAVIFLVGQGLESPEIVQELLDVEKNPRRPTYEMASDAPLVLWDCIFPNEESDHPEDALEWVYAGDSRLLFSGSGKGDGKFGLGGTIEDIWTVWRQRKIDETLAGALLDLAVSQGDKAAVDRGGFRSTDPAKLPNSQKVFYGGNGAKYGGKYIPVMKKRKMDPPEELNARYLASRERKQDRRGADEQ